MKLPMLPADKANHVIYGWLVASITLSVLLFINTSLWIIILLPFFSTIMVAVFKDYYLDKKSVKISLIQGKKPIHSIDFMDVIYTIIGGTISIAYFSLINYLS